MSKLLLKITLFIGINILVYVVVAMIPFMRFDFTNDTTESNLIAMPKGKEFDVLFMGTSHARIFTRNGNRERVEQILSKRTYNISNGGGHGGIFPESLLLKRFYEDGNSAKKIIYFADPWVFYSRQWNESNYFLDAEPFDVRFYLDALKNGTERTVFVSGLQSKLRRSWILLEPMTQDINISSFNLRDGKERETANRDFYFDGLNQDQFLRYQNMFEKIIIEAKANDAVFVVVLPTTLLGKLPGQENLWNFLLQMRTKYGIAIFDFSEAITDQKYYYNIDHLNSAGVEVFTKEYLLPLFNLNTDNPIIFDKLSS